MESIIHECCKKLKIGSTFYKGYKEIEASSNEEFLMKLLQKELINREAIRKNRLLKNAGFDVLKTFQDYSFDNIEIPRSISIDSIKLTDFIKKKENLILYGPAAKARMSNS